MNSPCCVGSICKVTESSWTHHAVLASEDGWRGWVGALFSF